MDSVIQSRRSLNLPEIALEGLPGGANSTASSMSSKHRFQGKVPVFSRPKQWQTGAKRGHRRKQRKKCWRWRRERRILRVSFHATITITLSDERWEGHRRGHTRKKNKLERTRCLPCKNKRFYGYRRVTRWYPRGGKWPLSRPTSRYRVCGGDGGRYLMRAPALKPKRFWWWRLGGMYSCQHSYS